MATNIIEGSMTTASLWLNMTYERYICPDKTKLEPPVRRATQTQTLTMTRSAVHVSTTYL